MENEERIDYFNTLVLSGGSIKGIALLGALSYLQSSKLLDRITNFIGTSIGSIICYLLSIGYSPIEIMVYLCTHKVLEKLTSLNVVSLFNGEGAMSFFSIQDSLEKMTVDKIGEFLTLGSLKEKYNKKLICVTYNYSKRKPEYLSPDTHPDIPCITAIRMSSNLPFVFERFKYMGDYYIDGGVANNFAIDILDDGINRIIGICVCTEKEYSGDGKEVSAIGILSYLYSLIVIPVNMIVNYNIAKASDRCKIISIILPEVNLFNFSLPIPSQLDMFSNGYTCAKNFFEN